MKADSIHLFDFLGNGKTIFEIPVFQRNYEWSIPQCEQLFNDLITAEKENQDHFIGAVVYVTNSGEKMSHIYRIIDGQQRLMSLTLLLKAISDVDAENKDEIEEQFLTNKYLEANNHLKLKPVDHDAEAFFAVMNGKEYNQPSKVIENYNYFQKQVADSGINASKLYEAMDHFDMVYIELTNEPGDENPQVIFESLNSTGVSLSASDLVRNFLLMSLNSEDQTRLYKEYWIKIEQFFTTTGFTEFLRHYLIMKTHALVKKTQVYEIYKKFYQNNNLNAEQALVDLYKFAGFYNEMLNAKTESSEFNRILKHINIMESKVVYPYFMMLLDMQQNSEIDWDKLINLAHIMESCLFRLKACRHATNGMNRIIITLCDKEKTKSDLQKNEIYRLNRNFPDDAEFKESLLEVNLYKLRNNLAKLALVVLEENRTRETINFDNAQVEHVMPQRLNNDWRLEGNNADKINEQLGGTIGNLTLTMYNQEMSNKLFSEKKEYYAKSNVSLTREISEKYQRWDKDAIIDRTRELSTELCQIFAKPDIKKEKAEDIVGEHAIDEEVDVTGKKPIRITLNDRDYSIDSWRSALVIFLNYVWAIDSRNFEKIRQDDSLDTKLFTHFNHPAVLANNMKIETNYSATTIVAIIAKIADLCDISNEVKYTIK
ncbi:DUF262 domain-containing HNH endonuclease family protein [Lactobacillus kefiranofaciens]|uniref:DUF262 domain-containing protein n=1 Tax=Lactobacillus kefiranofaciens TaxID=267818 RepID=UPI0024691EC4|nr:DUF262 domain-containing HNH endonuclease family protein [Lactobacillus kefiranofaciens]MDH5100589.1 DUF262 domain-containing HNH endonuclease family protein [Lactobacillus kefiranofaciens]